jgi:outer membrane autotransporter protein
MAMRLNSLSLPKKFAGGWFIEPQAQLVYQNNDGNDIAAQVRFADVNSLAGHRFGRTWAISSRTITAWIRPNLWNEFQGNPTTSFSSATRLRSVPREGFSIFHPRRDQWEGVPTQQRPTARSRDSFRRGGHY